MRVAIVADVYPPLRSSGAVQLRDLSREFVHQGHETTMLVASPGLESPYRIDQVDGVTVARLRTPPTRDMSYVRRTAGELLMPFAMRRNLSRSPLADRQFDAIIWYSPTIFLGPIVRWLKAKSRAPSYLVIRDIFPQWAADMGLISRGFAYRMLDAVANYQYRSADVIGVQTPGNLSFFRKFQAKNPSCRIEVLQNWLAEAPDQGCSINIAETKLAGRRIFVYAGNMGVAQHMDKMLDLAASLRDNADIGFIFVGRGSEATRLRADAERQGLENILFMDEIGPDEIPGLYRQCHVGLICLDSRHQTHNIPGKFLTYMQAGLPVLASINAGNDLEQLVHGRSVGRVSVEPEGRDLGLLARNMLEQELADGEISSRCRSIADELFSARAAVQQIVASMGQTCS